MHSLSSALAAHLAGEVTTLATCWVISRKDGVVLGLTDHDQPLVVDGVTYEATSGFTPSAVAASASLAVDNLDIDGALASDAIKESDLLAGRYDHAEITIFLVNYQDPSGGTLTLRTGWLGEVRLHGGRFAAEVRGLTQPLSQRLGALYTAGCRAQLGDARCKVDMAAHTVSGVLDGVDGSETLYDAARTEADGTFTNGAITFTSGANAGLTMEVKEFGSGLLRLVLPLPYAPAAGDAYTLKAGCDKTFATCCTRFNNAVNFRGEPHVPGTDRLLETAGTRSDWG